MATGNSNLKRVLDQTECMFTWELAGKYLRQNSIAKFRSYLESESFVRKWTVRTCLAYELFQDQNGAEAFAEINQAIEELAETEDALTKKYMRSCKHIVYGTKAFMVNQCHQDGGWWGVDDMPTVEEAVQRIPSKWMMSRAEKSGLSGFKAYSLNLYSRIGEAGPAISLFRRAMDLDPSEPAWRKRLLASLIRNGLYIQGENRKRAMKNYKIPYSLVSEPLQLIELILRDPDTSEEDKISAKYYKAVALEHYIENREGSAEYETTCDEIDELWRQVLRSQSENPAFIEYGAKWFLGNPTRQNPDDVNMVLEEVLRVFEMHPGDKGCRYAAKVVQRLPSNVKEHSETAQRILALYASQNSLEFSKVPCYNFDSIQR